MTRTYRLMSAAEFDAGSLDFARAPAPTTSVTSLAWNNTSGGDFALASNWLPAQAPDTTVSATIAKAGTYTVSVAAGESASAGALTLNNAGATLDIAGTLTIANGLSITKGALTGHGALKAAVTSFGSITATGGTLTIQGSLSSGNGVVTIAGGAGLELSGPVTATITFATPAMDQTSTLTFDTGLTTNTKIANFAAGDVIHLAGFMATSSHVGTVSTTNAATVTVTGTLNGVAATDTFKLVTNTSPTLALTSDGAGGTNIVLGTALPPKDLAWNNLSGGDFGMAGNWQPAATPTATTAATINQVGIYTVSVAAGEAAVASTLSVLGAGVTLDVSGTLTVGNGLTLVGGAITGDGTLVATVTNFGSIIADGGTLTLRGAVDSYGGKVTIDAGATLDVAGSVAGIIAFAAPTAGQTSTVTFDSAVTSTTQIAGFAAGDLIHLAGFVENAYQVGGVSVDGIATVTVSGTLNGAAVADSFGLVTTKAIKLSVTSDGAGGTTRPGAISARRVIGRLP
jgi:hypothetical protein